MHSEDVLPRRSVIAANAQPSSASAAPDAAAELLRKVFGYHEFRGHQREIIDHLVNGGDALVLMPTGGGKSLCYQIPALLRDGLGVVVSPLIALMQDQVAALQTAGVRAAYLNSTLSARQAADIETAARDGQLDLLYVAPERLLTDRCLQLLENCRPALFAIDEAHCVSQWGHDFRPEYIGLSIIAERFGGVPRIALTATADETTRREIIARLTLNDARQFVSSFDRPNIRYRIVEKTEPRKQLLQLIRDEHAGAAGIVYCATRARVDETAQFLVNHRITALPYHAGMSATERAEHLRRFLHEDGTVMVATIAFGMGIDKADVRFVAHLDMPRSLEAYYQETGRAGRDGLAADAWMSYGLADVVTHRQLIDASAADDDYKRVSIRKLDSMLALAEAADCRRVRILAYFGESSTPCGNCDNCLNPPRLIDASVDAQKLLSCVYRVNQGGRLSFGAQHVIDVLRGQQTDKVTQHGHQRLSTFGIGSDVSVTQWRTLLRQLVIQDLIAIDPGRFAGLSLTEASRAVLQGKQSVWLRESIQAPRASRGAGKRAKRGAEPPMLDTDAPMFEALRKWRSQTAQQRAVPAFVVFSDQTLRAIAQGRPNTRAALREISGVGDHKLELWGDALLELLQAPLTEPTAPPGR